MAKFKIVKPHFRTHRKNGHPSYIYAQSKSEYKYVGITYANKTHGVDNVKLRFNPNPKDSRPSYARPFATHDKQSSFKKTKLKGYKVHKADKKTFRRIKKNYRK